MFGNILIDKLRFSVKRDEINPYEAQYKLNAIMSEHFRKYYKELYAKLGIQSLDAAPELDLSPVDDFMDKLIPCN